MAEAHARGECLCMALNRTDGMKEACSAKMITAQKEVGNTSRTVTGILSQSGPGLSSYRILELEKTFRNSLNPTLSFYNDETEA